MPGSNERNNQMKNFRRINDEVYYYRGTIGNVGSDTITFLKRKAAETGRGRCRLCLHADSDAIFHDMIIVHTNETIVPPHKHLKRDESLHAIEGEAELILFEQDGRETTRHQIGADLPGLPFLVRIPANQYHSLYITSPWFVFHEATTGPFNPDESLIAPWWQ
jgi:cupin fold WbuC family metalloprotein